MSALPISSLPSGCDPGSGYGAEDWGRTEKTRYDNNRRQILERGKDHQESSGFGFHPHSCFYFWIFPTCHRAADSGCDPWPLHYFPKFWQDEWSSESLSLGAVESEAELLISNSTVLRSLLELWASLLFFSIYFIWNNAITLIPPLSGQHVIMVGIHTTGIFRKTNTLV